MLACLHDFKIFTSLDLKSGYYHTNTVQKLDVTEHAFEINTKTSILHCTNAEGIQPI